MIGKVTRQRLAPGPGEGPERRRQTDGAELLFGLAPQRHRLVGQMQAQVRGERHAQYARILKDERAALVNAERRRRQSRVTTTSLLICPLRKARRKAS